MFGYAMLLAMKESFSFRTYVNERALDQLKRYFIHINEQYIKPVESICPQNCDWIDNLYSPKRLALDPILSKGHLISYLDDVSSCSKRIEKLSEYFEYDLSQNFKIIFYLNPGCIVGRKPKWKSASRIIDGSIKIYNKKIFHLEKEVLQ